MKKNNKNCSMAEKIESGNKKAFIESRIIPIKY